MRKFFSVISRVIAGVFALFFVITTILAILFTDLNGQMFGSTLYKNAMVEQNIYGRLPEIVGVAITSNFLSDPCAQKPLACSIDGASPQLKACLTSALGTVAYDAIGSGRRSPTSTELQKAQSCLDQYGNKQETNSQPATTEGGMPPFMKNLTAADWQAILTIILPPDTLKTMTESTLDQMFAYLNGQVNTVAVPLEKLKERLLGPAGKVLILQLLNSQQPCSEQNLEQLIIGDASSGMVLCKPPEDMLPIVSAVLPDLLNSIVPQIPDKAVIIKPPAAYAATPGTGSFGSDPIATIHTVRLVMRLSPLVPLALLLLVSLFAVRSLISWMRWWGIPFVVSGLAALLMGVLAVPALNMVWTRLIDPRIPVYIPTDISGTGLELLRSIVHGISGWIIYPGIFLFVVGLTGWIGSYSIKIKRKPEAPNASPMPPS
jgi:hypothetical protein